MRNGKPVLRFASRIRLPKPLIALLLWLTAGGLQAASESAVEKFFSEPPLHQIEIGIAPSKIGELRNAPREDVPAQVKIDGQAIDNAAIHLKGAIGSFRPIDQNPSLTLDFGKFHTGRRIRGLDRLYLNNSIEDPSRLNELLGSELFRAAGIPAPRVGHARVTLNGRLLGLYVIKEGFTREFLAASFKRDDGNLYDTDLGHDVDQRMKRHSGSGPNDQADLTAIASVISEPDQALRWKKLGQILDLDEFLKFMALEVIVCHKDGYSLARNNFRIYHDPGPDRLIFLPSGMDQLFTPRNLPWQPHMAGLVARAVLETSEGQALYGKAVRMLFTKLFQPSELNRRVDEMASRLRPALESNEFASLENEMRLLNERIRLRFEDLQQQLNAPAPAFLEFRDGSAIPSGWVAIDSPPGGRMEQTRDARGSGSLQIVAGPITSASWRANVLLPAGNYSFEAEIAVEGFAPLPLGRNQGAWLRVGGRAREAGHGITGANPVISKVRFVVKDEKIPVDLVCEYRASSGIARFRRFQIKRNT